MKLRLMTTLALLAICVSANAAAAADVDISPETVNAISQPPLDKHQIAGQAFLEANKTKPGVVTLPDGLQYKIIKEGAGAHPDESDVVTVEYEGKLIDGTVFDSSATHGGTVDFPLGQVIAGWVEALKLMKAGGTWEIYIPSDLAYGPSGSPPAIGPNETLVFKVTLVSFKKA
jgi:FKBP-type peptidyl-prolyl cis-trans isomerase FklB